MKEEAVSRQPSAISPSGRKPKADSRQLPHDTGLEAALTALGPLSEKFGLDVAPEVVVRRAWAISDAFVDEYRKRRGPVPPIGES